MIGVAARRAVACVAAVGPDDADDVRDVCLSAAAMAAAAGREFAAVEIKFAAWERRPARKRSDRMDRGRGRPSWQPSSLSPIACVLIGNETWIKSIRLAHCTPVGAGMQVLLVTH